MCFLVSKNVVTATRGTGCRINLQDRCQSSPGAPGSFVFCCVVFFLLKKKKKIILCAELSFRGFSSAASGSLSRSVTSWWMEVGHFESAPSLTEGDPKNLHVYGPGWGENNQGCLHPPVCPLSSLGPDLQILGGRNLVSVSPTIIILIFHRAL